MHAGGAAARHFCRRARAENLAVVATRANSPVQKNKKREQPIMKTKYFCASVMVASFFLANVRASVAETIVSEPTEVFFEDFEAGLGQWNFPSPNLHGFPGANLLITGDDSYAGSGSGTFTAMVIGGSAFTDRIAVTGGSTYRLQLAHKGPLATTMGGWVGFNLYSSDDEATYLREKWMMGPQATDDYQTSGSVKANGSFDMVELGPANNLIWDSADWKIYSASFTIPAGDVNYLSFKMEGTPDVFFDNVRVELIPEPSTALLALFALSGLLACLPGREFPFRRSA